MLPTQLFPVPMLTAGRCLLNCLHSNSICNNSSSICSSRAYLLPTAAQPCHAAHATRFSSSIISQRQLQRGIVVAAAAAAGNKPHTFMFTSESVTEVSSLPLCCVYCMLCTVCTVASQTVQPPPCCKLHVMHCSQLLGPCLLCIGVCICVLISSPLLCHPIVLLLAMFC
jgi:hypothetical protein